MIGRAIRTAFDLPFRAGDWLIQRSPIGGEIMPCFDEDSLDNVMAALRATYTEDALSVTNVTDRSYPIT